MRIILRGIFFKNIPSLFCMNKRPGKGWWCCSKYPEKSPRGYGQPQKKEPSLKLQTHWQPRESHLPQLSHSIPLEYFLKFNEKFSKKKFQNHEISSAVSSGINPVVPFIISTAAPPGPSIDQEELIICFN